jgi:hypothetical protein
MNLAEMRRELLLLLDGSRVADLIAVVDRLCAGLCRLEDLLALRSGNQRWPISFERRRAGSFVRSAKNSSTRPIAGKAQSLHAHSEIH